MALGLFERVIDVERDRQIPLETVEEFIDAGLMRTLILR